MGSQQKRTPSLAEGATFQLLIDAVTDYAIFLLDVNGHISTWNPGAQRIKGYDAQEVLGHHFSMFYTPEERRIGKPERALQTARAAGRYEDEGWRVRKDGTRFWALAVLDPVYDESGTLIGFAKVTRDMTERRRAQEALIESERRFRLLVESVVDYAIFMLDPDGTVTNWNTGARRLKGYAQEEIVGRHFSRFYTPEERAAGLPERALRIAAAEGRFEAEGPRVRKDGTQFWAHVVIDPIRSPSGELLGFAKITRDITEKREAQKALQEAQDQLFQSQKLEALGQLTGGVAHDFNNLLAAMMSGVALLERIAAGGERAKQVLAAMRQAARRGETLTQQLLSFARRQSLRPEVIHVPTRIAEALNLLERLLTDSIRVVLDLPAELWRLRVDPGQLELAVLNVCLNARDAMPTGGTLVIRARNVQPAAEGAAGSNRYVEIAVSDTGTGIPEAIRSRIFEPFFTTKQVGKGSGLGLSQAYGFVQQSGGSISVDSEVGKGTTIRLLLPAVEAPTVAADAVPAAGGVDRRASGTLLLVEDDPAVAELSAALLEHAGYTVVRAGSAPVALDMLRGNRTIDVVFSDVVMPGGMDGIDLAHAIRKEFPAIPVLLTTAFGHRISDPRETGVQLVRKPYDLVELMGIIDKLIADAKETQASAAPQEEPGEG